MKDRSCKLLLAALAVALLGPHCLWPEHRRCLGAAFAADAHQERGARHGPLEKERDYWVDLFGPTVAVEEGEDFEARLAHFQRYMKLYETFAQVMAKEVGLESPAPWELHPDILYFQTTLAQTALNGEAACEDNRKCAVGVGDPTTAKSEVAACSGAPSCDRRHIGAMSGCGAILNSRCRSVAELLCKRLRRQAYDLCVDVAACQRECCLGYCSGTSCATWAANDKTGVQCTDCTPPTPTLPPG